MLRPTLVTLIALLSTVGARTQDNLLRNGGFESSSGGVIKGWQNTYPVGRQSPPKFECSLDGVHGGKACARITTIDSAGFSSFTQVVGSLPNGAKTAVLEGWIHSAEPAPGQQVAGQLLLLFLDDEDEDRWSLHYSRRIAGPGPWSRARVVEDVPPWADKIMVRAASTGVGSVAFDDLVLSCTNETVETARLAVAEAYYVVTGRGKADCRASFSIPITLGGQTPVAVRVRSEPEGAVQSLRLLEDRENRPLEVGLGKLAKGAEVKLHVETLCMLRDRKLDSGMGKPLAQPEALPADVRVHLKGAFGVDCDDDEIREAAAGFARDDVKSLTADLSSYMRKRLTYARGLGQDGKSSLASGKAVCTGFANVAASLLIAVDVPTRILACTTMDGALQEHYIVELWSPELGWSRLESTALQFPWGDRNNLVLRVIYPDSARAPGCVPLDPIRIRARGVKIRYGAVPGNAICWQSGWPIEDVIVGADAAESVADLARSRFENMRKKPVKGAKASWVPESKRSVRMRDGAAELLEAIDAWVRG